MLLLSYEIAFIRHCQLIIWLWLVSLGEFMHWVDSQQKDTHMGKVSNWLFHLCFSETSQGSRPAQRLCGIRSILQKMKFQTLTSQTCSTQHLGLDIVVAANFTLSLKSIFCQSVSVRVILLRYTPTPTRSRLCKPSWVNRQISLCSLGMAPGSDVSRWQCFYGDFSLQLGQHKRPHASRSQLGLAVHFFDKHISGINWTCCYPAPLMLIWQWPKVFDLGLGCLQIQSRCFWIEFDS